MPPLSLTMPVLLHHKEQKPVGELTLTELETAHARALRDARAMLRRDATARAYSNRTYQAVLYDALADELRDARLKHVHQLPPDAQRRALGRAAAAPYRAPEAP